MIKVSKSMFELHQLANNHYNLLVGDVFDICEKLENILKDKKIQPYEKSFFKEIKYKLKKIITSNPEELTRIHKEIEPLYQAYLSKKSHGLNGNHRKAAIKKANDKILGVFDYANFIKKFDAKYAYQFTEKLDINVCVYCNRQFTFTLYTTSGKCRPTLDHFFDKGKHPYFALSFFNLIPSCYTCNSSLKNQKKFTLDKYLHPFYESMFDVLDFGINISSVDFVNGVKNDFDISLKPSKNCTDNNLITKAKANAELFKIKELYDGHKDYASEIIKRSYFYDKSRIDDLCGFKTDKGKSLFESRTEVLEFALGNYISEQKLGKRVLAKFTRDIAFDLGMDKLI